MTGLPPVFAALATLLVVGAGCLGGDSGSDAAQASPSDSTAPGANNTTAPPGGGNGTVPPANGTGPNGTAPPRPPRPDPVRITAGEDVAGSLNKTFDWEVKAAPYNVTIQVRFGPHSAYDLKAAYQEGYAWQDSAGDGKTCTGGVTLTVPVGTGNDAGGCNLNATAASPPGAERLGAWSLRVSATQCVCHYSVEVRVDYP